MPSATGTHILQLLHPPLNLAGKAIPTGSGQVNVRFANFEKYDPNDPRLISSIKVSPIAELSNSAKQHASVTSWHVRSFDNNGKELEPDKKIIRSVQMHQEQDVLDLLVYYKDAGEYYLAVNKVYRPALATRQADPIIDSVYCLPGMYISSERGFPSIEATTASLLATKIGVTARDANCNPDFNGSAYFPSVGGSTELAIPRTIEVNPPEFKAAVTFDNKFAGPLIREFFTPQTIVDKYFSGEIQDLRLVLAVFRFCDEKGIKLNVNLNLSQETASLDLSAISREVLNTAQFREQLRPINVEAGKPAHIQIEKAPDPENPFLKLKHYQVSYENGLGEVTLREISVVERRGSDSVDVATYCLKDDQVLLKFKRGLRPAISIRDSAEHPISQLITPLNPEVVAGSMEPGEGKDQILYRAKAEVQEEIKHNPIGEPAVLTSVFPSPGFNAEKVAVVLSEFDPRSKVEAEQGLDETLNTYLLDVNDIISLSKSGTIRDPRLILYAYILRDAFQVATENINLDASEEERKLFTSIVNSGSRQQAFLSEESLEADRLLCRLPVYRQVKRHCENDLGVIAVTMNHADEKPFFSPIVPIFSDPWPDDKRTVSFRFSHDHMHYVLGEPIPAIVLEDRSLAQERDKIRITDFATYRYQYAYNEAKAMLYSDFTLPYLAGLDEVEKIFSDSTKAKTQIFSGPFLARALVNLGADDPQKAFNLIESIELHAKIPVEILQDTERYLESRDVLIKRLLKRHVLINHHSKLVYDRWKEYPLVAEVAAKVAPQVFGAETDVAQHSDAAFHQATSPVEGDNPFKALFAHTINTDIRIPALRIAYYLESAQKSFSQPELSQQLAIIAAREMLELIFKANEELRIAQQSITSQDFSEKNLKLFRVWQDFKDNTVPKIDIFCERFTNNELLFSTEFIAENGNKLLPFFSKLSLSMDADKWREIQTLEYRNFEVNQIPIPEALKHDWEVLFASLSKPSV